MIAALVGDSWDFQLYKMRQLWGVLNASCPVASAPGADPNLNWYSYSWEWRDPLHLLGKTTTKHSRKTAPLCNIHTKHTNAGHALNMENKLVDSPE